MGYADAAAPRLSELDDMASGNAEKLSAAIPGFGAALTWPNAEDAQLPCWKPV